MIKLRKGHIVELRIDKMAYGGQGVARLNGLVIFIKGAIPGDRISGLVIRKKNDRIAGTITRQSGDPMPL